MQLNWQSNETDICRHFIDQKHALLAKKRNYDYKTLKFLPKRKLQDSIRPLQVYFFKKKDTID